LVSNDKERSRFRHHKNKKEEEQTRNELKTADQVRKARNLKQKQKDRFKRKRSSKGGPRKKTKALMIPQDPINLKLILRNFKEHF